MLQMKNEIPIDWRWTFKICFVWFTVGFDSLIKFLKRKNNFEGTHGFEPWTYRTAADCSTTELYPQAMLRPPLFESLVLTLTDETFATRVPWWRLSMCKICRDQDSNLGYCGHNAGS